MRYVCAGILAVVFAVGGVGSAAAEPRGGERPRTEFIDMEEYFVKGKRRLPLVLMFKGRDRPRFVRLLNLRRSFVREILRSGEGL